jgi:hypothetical protein
VEHIPILDQTNLLTLTAVDAAGNSTVTNLPIIRSQSALTINPVPPNELWQLQVTVTGRVDPPDQAVWLNGKRAMVDGNGEWSVTGILTTSEGVAIFEAVAIPNSKRPKPLLEYASDSSVSVVPKESVSVAAVLNSNALTLNASQPTYGKFTLHLSGAAGRSYVISSSTNLVDWDPILTNLNSGPTFDYNDTNAVAYGCRFFRVTPFR